MPLRRSALRRAFWSRLALIRSAKEVFSLICLPLFVTCIFDFLLDLRGLELDFGVFFAIMVPYLSFDPIHYNKSIMMLLRICS